MKTQEKGTLFLVLVCNREVRSSFGSSLIHTFQNRGGIMKEFKSTSSTSSLRWKLRLRGFFCKSSEEGFEHFHRTVKCTYLVDIVAEFAVVASNCGCHSQIQYGQGRCSSVHFCVPVLLRETYPVSCLFFFSLLDIQLKVNVRKGGKFQVKHLNFARAGQEKVQVHSREASGQSSLWVL